MNPPNAKGTGEPGITGSARAICMTAAAVAMIMTAAGCTSAPALRPGPPVAVGCVSRSVPVDVGGAPAQVTGQLCQAASSRTLQILVPGATDDAAYWDVPVQPQSYSYVYAVVKAGYATWAINRPGTAPSTSYPPAAVLTIPDQAAALHQVITAVKGWGYDRIIVAGHGVGSWIALEEAATWHDVSALILTGALHTADPAGVAAVRARWWPASADPRFAGERLPAGYFTTRPGTRAAVFCGDCTAAVDQEDEALKTTATMHEIAGIGPVDAGSPRLSRAISVPVLLVVGQEDQLECGPGPALSCSSSLTIFERETAWYSPAARLRAFVLPDAPHDINFAPDAIIWFTAAIQWAGVNAGGADGG